MVYENENVRNLVYVVYEPKHYLLVLPFFSIVFRSNRSICWLTPLSGNGGWVRTFYTNYLRLRTVSCLLTKSRSKEKHLRPT